MVSATPVPGGDFPDWDGGLEEDEDAGYVAPEGALESAEGRCHYCRKPLDDHPGWMPGGKWPYMQPRTGLICEKWVPTNDG